MLPGPSHNFLSSLNLGQSTITKDTWEPHSMMPCVHGSPFDPPGSSWASTTTAMEARMAMRRESRDGFIVPRMRWVVWMHLHLLPLYSRWRGGPGLLEVGE